MKSFRIERIESIIMHQIATLIVTGKIKDHRVTPMVSINHVKVSKDLAHAKVWVSVLGDDQDVKSAVEGLSSAAGFIQTFLGKQMRTRQTPRLLFKEDHSIEESIRIQNKMKDLLPDDEK